MIVDHRVLVPAHIADRLAQLPRHVRQVFAHSFGESDAVGAALLQLRCEVRGVSLRVCPGQLQRHGGNEVTRLLPEPLDRPGRRSYRIATEHGHPASPSTDRPASHLCDMHA